VSLRQGIVLSQCGTIVEEAFTRRCVPGRKTPLERDIRVSSSLEQIEAIWSHWHGEQFGKGWAES
jgi:hypothetical protein